MNGLVGATLTDEDAQPARVIPCLLLAGNRLMKTIQFADPSYVGDPVNVLSIFNSFEVDEIVLLDIDRARSRVPADVDQLRHYAEECFIPLSYGGGISTIAEMEAILAAGYEKVILNTVLAYDPGLLREASRVFGAQAIVGSIDVRGGIGGKAYVRGAAEPIDVDPVEWARRAEDLGVGEILLTSVDREGTMDGFDLELTSAVSTAVGIPVIAHGGAGKRSHLTQPVQEAGASAVAAGSLFVYQGIQRGVLINYPNRQQLKRSMTR